MSTRSKVKNSEEDSFYDDGGKFDRISGANFDAFEKYRRSSDFTSKSLSSHTLPSYFDMLYTKEMQDKRLSSLESTFQAEMTRASQILVSGKLAILAGNNDWGDSTPVHVYDLEEKKLVRTIAGSHGHGACLDVWKNCVVFGSNFGGVTLADFTTGEVKWSVKHSGEWPNLWLSSVRFVDNGDSIVCKGSGVPIEFIVSSKDGSIQNFSRTSDLITAFHVAPDHTTYLVALEKGLIVKDSQTSKVIATVGNSHRYLVDWLSNDEIVYQTTSRQIEVRNIRKNFTEKTITTQDELYALSVTPNKKFVICATQSVVYFYDVKTFQIIAKMKYDYGTPNVDWVTVNFCEALDLLVIGTRGHKLPKGLLTAHSLQGVTNTFDSLAIENPDLVLSPDGKYIAYMETVREEHEWAVNIINLMTMKQIKSSMGHLLRCITFSSNSKKILAFAQTHAEDDKHHHYVIDCATGDKEGLKVDLYAEDSPIVSCVTSHDGKTVACGTWYHFQFLNSEPNMDTHALTSQSKKIKFTGFKDKGLTDMKFTDDDSVLAISETESQAVFLVNRKTQAIKKLEGYLMQSKGVCFDFLDNSRLVAACNLDPHIKVWDFANFDEPIVEKFISTSHNVQKLGVSRRNSEFYLITGDSKFQIMDFETGYVEKSYAIEARSFALNGSIIYITEGQTMLVSHREEIFSAAKFEPVFLPSARQAIDSTLTTCFEELRGQEDLLYESGILDTNFNLLHKFAYENNSRAIKIILYLCKEKKIRVPFVRDLSGRTPMHYALERFSIPVLDILQTEISNYPHNYFEAIRDIFPKLISLRMDSTIDLINQSVIQPPSYQQEKLPQTGVIVDGKFNIAGSNEMWAPLAKMEGTLYPSDEAGRIKAIQTRLVSIPDIFDPELTMKCVKSGFTTLFASRVIQGILTYKWETFARRKYYMNLAVYFVFFGLFMLLVMDVEHYDAAKWGLTALVVIVNSFFALKEVQQIMEEKMYYFTGPWNWIDFSLVVLVYFHSIFNVFTNDQSTVDKIAGWAILVSWAKILSYLRGFRTFGTIIAMIVEMTYSIRYYFLIVILILFGFSHAALLTSDLKFENELESSYNLMLGNFETAGLSINEWCRFIPFSFVLVILMTNLLIAVMSEKFVQIMSRYEETSYYEWARWIVELEQEVTFTPKEHPKYLLLCFPDRSQASEGMDELTQLHKNKEKERKLNSHMGSTSVVLASLVEEVSSIKDSVSRTNVEIRSLKQDMLLLEGRVLTDLKGLHENLSTLQEQIPKKV